MEKEEIRAESLMSNEQAVAYLEDIVGSLKAGKIHLEHGENAITLNPPDTVLIQLKAKRKADKESISLKIGWRRQVAPDDAQADIRISSDEE